MSLSWMTEAVPFVPICPETIDVIREITPMVAAVAKIGSQSILSMAIDESGSRPRIPCNTVLIARSSAVSQKDSGVLENGHAGMMTGFGNAVR